MNATGTLLIVGYLLVYATVVTAIWMWRLNRKQERPPTPERLLRAPGETLRRELERFDDTLLLHFMVSGLGPLLIMTAGLAIAEALPPPSQPWALAVLLVCVIAALWFGTRWLIQILNRRRNFYLGYFGERVVGEGLEELRVMGYKVFHDVPALEASPPFNLDHVIVGPTGVFAIETKTRRKGPARQGVAEHKIIANGPTLQFPWGEDNHGLVQAEERARWLREWIRQVLGREVPVQAVLTFPGWWVEDRGIGPIRVVNPKQIKVLVTHHTHALSAEQIQVIARQLEARCRDVEF